MSDEHIEERCPGAHLVGQRSALVEVGDHFDVSNDCVESDVFAGITHRAVDMNEVDVNMEEGWLVVEVCCDLGSRNTKALFDTSK